MMEEIIQKAREWALAETEKYGTPPPLLLEAPIKKGKELAKQLGANKEIVELGTWLMDIKLGECKSEGKREKHIERSAEATKNFLEEFDISEGTKEKIINCVEAHHATVPFKCKEAEICANADCYKFLLPMCVFEYIRNLSSKNNLEKILEQAEFKLDEKWNILSLDICKEELEPYYKMFKSLFNEARKA